MINIIVLMLMKMLAKNGDIQYLHSLKQRLEENGIPANIQGENTARMLVPNVAFEPTLWIYLDDQFEEAKELLEDPTHVVKNQINVVSFYENLPSEEEQRSAVTDAFLHLGWVVGLIVLGMLLLIKILYSL